jgi:hypothetical protein
MVESSGDAMLGGLHPESSFSIGQLIGDLDHMATKRRPNRLTSASRTPGQPSSLRPHAYHLMLKWNPADAFEPNTIEVHAEILAKTPGDDSHAWWGKISKSNRLGLSAADVRLIKRQLASGLSTYLYLYCPDKPRPTLHAALLSGISTARPPEPDRIPLYYSKLDYPIPYWFRITDIRELSLEYLNKLVTRDGQTFDPVQAHSYPRLVEERGVSILFDYRETGGAKWHVLQRASSPGPSMAALDPRLVFALMPFSDVFTDVWNLGIRPSIQSLGLSCKRADDFLHNRQIMEVIRENIRRARLLIADMTGNNPNVFYELGYAHALDKPVVLLTQDRKQVPFDLLGINSIEYRNATDLSRQLPNLVKSVLGLNL